MMNNMALQGVILDVINILNKNAIADGQFQAIHDDPNEIAKFMVDDKQFKYTIWRIILMYIMQYDLKELPEEERNEIIKSIMNDIN